MKYFLPLFILLFTFSAFGSNWYSVSEFNIENLTVNQNCAVTVTPSVIELPYVMSSYPPKSFDVEAASDCQWVANASVFG